MRRIALILLTVVMFGLSAYARRLTAFLPEPDKANGAAVIVCPGGSYYWLSRKVEGAEVARRLAEAGFTAFVLQGWCDGLLRRRPSCPEQWRGSD